MAGHYQDTRTTAGRHPNKAAFRPQPKGRSDTTNVVGRWDAVQDDSTARTKYQPTALTRLPRQLKSL